MNFQCEHCDHRHKCPYPEERELVEKNLLICPYHTNEESREQLRRIFGTA